MFKKSYLRPSKSKKQLQRKQKKVKKRNIFVQAYDSKRENIPVPALARSIQIL